MNNSKKLIGFIWFLIFVVVLFITATSIGDSRFNIARSFSDVKAWISQLFERESGQYKGPRTIVTQQVVKEESVVIDAVEKVSPSVVSIVVKTFDFSFFSGVSETESGIGTGFIVDSNGLIVTNSHVVDNPEGEYSVVLKDGTNYDVQKIHLDQVTDLAILEITARDLPVVDFGDSDVLKAGQMAIAIGNALGRFQNTVTVGVVSGVGREIVASGGFGGPQAVYENAIQTDAALNPGNSGGPLLNSSGQVIGVSVATSIGADNVSFAIPVNILKPILDGFIKEGRIIKPFMGVRYVMISKEIADLRDMPEGAFISSVLRDTPADEAGLKRGDIIVRFDGQDVTTQNSLAKVISASEVGKTIEIVIDRDGERISLSLTLEESPERL